MLENIMVKYKKMNKKLIKALLLSTICLVFNGCSDEEEMCEFTYDRPDGSGNYITTTVEYPCELGPPVTEPVNKK
ncbi:hypothetical protein KUL113_55830 [Tenacibaculum sp. KUL113]|nr:hypothetical protein KUL113_55830 [Tenacibaculum sp. KUL113]